MLIPVYSHQRRILIHIRTKIDSPALEHCNKNENEAISDHPNHDEYDELLQLLIAGYKNSACQQEHGNSGGDACRGKQNLACEREFLSDCDG